MVQTQPQWLRYLRLVLTLVRRDIRAAYRRSFLGPLWAVIPPVMTMLVFSLLRGVLNIPTDGVPPIIFLFSAILPWTFFTNIANRVAPSILSNTSIMQKMPVPRIIFTFVSICSAAFDFAIASLVMLGLMVYFRVPLTGALLWLPVLLLLTALIGWSVGMVFTSVGIYRRDFLKMLGYILQFWFYATPIIYPLSRIPEQYRPFYALNPMVGLIEGFRAVLVRGQAPDVNLLLYSLLVGILIWCIAYPLFRTMSRYFTDVL